MSAPKKTEYAPFQQATIDAACAHFQTHTRVLCADEAGLGKTYIARGIIERMADERLEEAADPKNCDELQTWWNDFCQINADKKIFGEDKNQGTSKDDRWKIIHDFLELFSDFAKSDAEWRKHIAALSQKTWGDKQVFDYSNFMQKLIHKENDVPETGIDWWQWFGGDAESWKAFYKKFLFALPSLFLPKDKNGRRQTTRAFFFPRNEKGDARLPYLPFRVLYVCCNLDIAEQNTGSLIPTKPEMQATQNSSRSRTDKPDRLSVLWYYLKEYPNPYLEVMPITATLTTGDTRGNQNEAAVLKRLYKGLQDTELGKEEIIKYFRPLGEDKTREVYDPDLIIFDEFQNFAQIINVASGKTTGTGGDADRIAKFCGAFLKDPNKKARLLLLSATPFHDVEDSAGAPTRLDLNGIIDFMGGKHTDYNSLTTAASREAYLYHTCGIFRTERLRLLGKDNAAYHLLKCDSAKLLPFAAYLQGNGGGNVASRAVITTPDLECVPNEYKNELNPETGLEMYMWNPDVVLSHRDHPRYQRLLDVVTAANADDVTEDYNPGLVRNLGDISKLLWIPPVKPSHALGGVFALYKDFSKTLVFSNLRITPLSVTALLNGEVKYKRAKIDKVLLKSALEDYLADSGAEQFGSCANVLADYFLRVGGNAFASVPEFRQYCSDGCLSDVLNEFAALQKENVDPLDELKKNLTFADDPLWGKFAAPMDAATTGVCRDAFNTPFLPFVLMTTSIGTEGLDFHLYCNRLAHYTCPANVVELEQKNGRIDRRRSLAQRRWWAMPGAAFRKTYTFGEMSERSGGLVPDWDAGENNLHYYFFYNEFTDEHSELDELFDEQNAYRRALGVNKELLPELMNLSPFLRKKPRAELHWFSCGKLRRKLHGK